MLAINQIEFVNVPIESAPALAALRASDKLPFDQLPLLEIDGLCLSQSSAMVRYLARRGDLYGATDAEALEADMVAAAADDPSETAKLAAFQASEDTVRQALRVRFDKFGPRFESRLRARDTGWCAAHSMTFADVVLAEALTEYLAWLPDLLNDTPMLAALQARVLAQPGVAAYLHSPQRYPLADTDYVMSVARVLQRALPAHMADANRFVITA